MSKLIKAIKIDLPCTVSPSQILEALLGEENGGLEPRDLIDFIKNNLRWFQETIESVDVIELRTIINDISHKRDLD